MARAKISYKLIANERTRRETFKKRRTGLFRKLNELTTLCNIEVCAVVTSGDGTETEVWPSPFITSQIVQRFMNMPTSSRTQHTVDQAEFYRKNLFRITRNCDKEEMKVESLERELLLAECLIKEEAKLSNSNHLHEMLRLLEKKIAMVDRRIVDVKPFCSRAAEANGRNNERYHGKGKQPL